MADFKLEGKLLFGTDEAVRNIKTFEQSLGKTGQHIRSFGSEVLQNMGTLFTQLGASMTGSIAGAVALARNDLPQVNYLLRDVTDSMHAMAEAVTEAVVPDLENLRDVMEGLAGVVKGFAERHGELIRQFLKYGLIATAIGAVSYALGGLVRIIGLTILLFTKLGIVSLVLNPIFLQFSVILGAVALIVYGLTKAFPQLGAAISGFTGNVFQGFLKVTGLSTSLKAFQRLIQEMQGDFEQGAKRTTRVFENFVKGIQSGIKDLRGSIQEFGNQVRTSLDGILSDSIYNSITGKITDLKAMLLKFADDIAKAFSRFASNEIMTYLFGDKEGSRRGLFGGLFGRGSGGGGGVTNNITRNIQVINNQIGRTSRQFDDLSGNMRKFARAKDDAIDKLKEFSRALLPPGGGAGGAAAGPVGFGASLAGVGVVSEETLESLNVFNGILGLTSELVGRIVQGWRNMQKETIKQGITYAAVTAAMLGVSAAAAAASVAISGSAAAALAAAWAPAAIAASIATFGVAAAVGAAAYTGAVGTGTAFTSGLSSHGASSFPGNISIGGMKGIEGFGASGAVVNQPTLAMIGEAGPEAVVPLSRVGRNRPLPAGGGASRVEIYINEAKLNNPANMREFVRFLKEEMAR